MSTQGRRAVWEGPYLEEREAPVVLKENAANAPDVTGLCPAQL